MMEHRSEHWWSVIHTMGMTNRLGRLLQMAVAASWRRGMTIGLGFAWVRFSLFVPMDSHKLLMKI